MSTECVDSLRRGRRWAAYALLAIVATIVPSPEAGASGTPPPEWGRNLGGWPSHNYDLANTRATTQTPINSRNVSRLRVKWRFPIQGEEPYGAYATNPIVLGDTVYTQDLKSNVYAIDNDTGRLKWKRTFDIQNTGPDGVAYGWGKIFGATSTTAFALDARTGAVLWTRELLRLPTEGIDITPQLYDDTVFVSTVPATLAGYLPGGMGIAYALDPATGRTKWSFNTVKDGDLWGHPEINSGGGVWYPPAVDKQGRVYFGTGNPGPFPGTPEYPNGTSRPGPNLYTNSLISLDGQTGRLRWYYQAVPHDIRDRDLAVSPILTDLTFGGAKTPAVLTAGKNGKVYAHATADGRLLWQRSFGRRENDSGLLPDTPVTVFPGGLGGIVTPMALANNRLFVPWMDQYTIMSATAYEFPDFTQGTGGLTALDPRTGTTLWERRLPHINTGAATVANDVVFTAGYDGKIYAFDARSGQTLWTQTARAGINAFPAIAGDTLLIGAGAKGTFDQPVTELIAYELQ